MNLILLIVSLICAVFAFSQIIYDVIEGNSEKQLIKHDILFVIYIVLFYIFLRVSL